MSGVGESGGAVREGAVEELIRAEARVLHAHAATVEWLLRCIVAFAAVLIVGAAIGDSGLAATCLLTIATLGAVVRSAKGPRGRGRSSVM
jgi:hypothetical protein